ncbi:hypothetical protein [Nocardia paucivorans]|uniref:hypothetical protein n=1 Tax=Nocardia paucivorans TaxID=114259 RepID=UPI0002D99FE5|nr:hypothetical protein [Nocardia paucivorans]
MTVFTPDPAMNLEIVARMPWLVAESGSIWAVTGTTATGRTFAHEPAIVAPYDLAQGGKPLFVLVHPDMYLYELGTPPLVAADRISAAYRLVLVHADEPTTAYYLDDQDLINRGWTR